MKARKILIIEDDRKISDLVKIYLEKEGFQTTAAFDGKEAIESFNEEKPDFVILDLMLPEIDGIEVARRIRKKSDIPILMLTAKSEEFDKVLGLEMGADDYLTKPFSPKELMARVRAILRRTTPKAVVDDKGKIRIKDLEIDWGKFQLKQRKKAIHLSVLEFKLLYALASNPGRVFSRDQLMYHIYENENEVVLDRTIDVHIKNIRKKLKDSSRHPTYIESVFGVGYRFKEDENQHS